MFNSLLIRLILATLFFITATNARADQQFGAQIYSKQSFGYGKLVAELQYSTEPGIVNGFFMLKYFDTIDKDGAWPYGWTEIDDEYVPGNILSMLRTAEGDCGQAGGACIVGKLGNQSAANYLSFNIIGGPLNANPPDHDSQVFYKLSQDFFAKMNTYVIEFNPDQVKWSINGINQDRPVMYQKSGTDYTDIHQSLGMQYLVNRNMHIWFNIYSGLGGDWGGRGTIPQSNTQMIVKNVAYYPAIAGSCEAGACQYSKTPSMSSDFVNGVYLLNGAPSNFDAIWTNTDSNNYPVFTRASNTSINPGQGLVMKYIYSSETK